MLGRLAVLALSCGVSAADLYAQLPAFPGAEGFGARATGGRGGAVVKVTTLAPTGPGSLQAALDVAGPRIVVFDVSGVITGDFEIPHGNLTIAGQSAPGAGITIHGHLVTPWSTTFGNLVIRHLRVRAPEPSAEWPADSNDAMQLVANQLMMLDHVSLSHGSDEILDLYGAREITIQWSTIALACQGCGHPDGADHHYGLINGPDGGLISVHHVLFAHDRARTPAISYGPAEVVNNVVYNARQGFVHHNPAVGDMNLIGNFYKDGGSEELLPFWFDPDNGPTVPSRYYVWDNWVDDPGVFTNRVDNPFTTPGFEAAYPFYCCGIASSQFNAVGEFDFSDHTGYVPIARTAPDAAYDAVLDRAGAWPRDVVDGWVVDETRTRTGSSGNRRPANWLEGLAPDAPLPDPDADGIPSEWESSHGLNPGVYSPNVPMPSGYSAIEEYLNELANRIEERIFADGFQSQGVTRWSLHVP